VRKARLMLAHRARRRPAPRGMVHRQPRQQLARTPVRPRLAERHDRAGGGGINRQRLAMTRPAPIRQTGGSGLFITLQPFVAGLPADPEAGAQPTHRFLFAQTCGDETQAIVHQASLGPGHDNTSGQTPCASRECYPCARSVPGEALALCYFSATCAGWFHHPPPSAWNSAAVSVRRPACACTSANFAT
jgi:hypothetical protein